jgi:hypothetical protein
MNKDKIRELLCHDPKSRVIALFMIREWTLWEICTFLDSIRKQKMSQQRKKEGLKNSEVTLIVLCLFSSKLVDSEAWRGWDAMMQYARQKWNRDKVPDRCGILDKYQVCYRYNLQTVSSFFGVTGRYQPFDPNEHLSIDLTKEAK